jgi:hypothetical protein
MERAMHRSRRQTSDKDEREPQLGEKLRKPQLGEKPKPGRQRGGDPRTLPGSQDLGDQDEPQDRGGMVKGT